MQLRDIKVQDYMTRDVISIAPDAALSTAHQTMKEYGIRRLPVVKSEKLVGIITLGDVREASPSDASSLSIWEMNYLWAQLTVGKVMTRDVETVTPTDSIIAAAELMLNRKLSGLPVVDNGKVVGMITESDIFRMVVRSQLSEVAG